MPPLREPGVRAPGDADGPDPLGLVMEPARPQSPAQAARRRDGVGQPPTDRPACRTIGEVGDSRGVAIIAAAWDAREPFGSCATGVPPAIREKR
jgi:hypothetical protein